MSYAALDSTFLVAGQLTAADLPALPAQGIKVLLCLRPDDEEGEYAASNALRAEAEALGLEFVAAPIRGLDINAAALSALADLEGRFGEGDSPEVLAYCRSGRRVAVAWAHLKRGQGLSVDAILAQAQGAGHDLTPVAEALAALAPVAADRLASMDDFRQALETATAAVKASSGVASSAPAWYVRRSLW
ncbi:MAG: TIGR01244 family sulfur transferase, partial [Pseudomonadales bacterium]